MTAKMNGWIITFVAVCGIASGAPAVPDESALLCEMCHLMVQEVKNLVQENKTQDEIINYVKEVCSRLPESDQALCYNFVNGSAAGIFIKLAEELNPQQLCAMLPNVCPTAKPVVVRQVAVLPEPEEEQVGGFVECEVCKLAVLGLDKLLKANKSRAEINATLEELCNSLPGEAGTICKKEEGLILKALEAGVEPSLACRLVKLCLTAAPEHSNNDLETEIRRYEARAPEQMSFGEGEITENESKQPEVIEQAKQVGDDARCELCQYVVLLLDQVIKTNGSEKQINDTLMTVCNILPANFKTACYAIAAAALPEIEKGLDPNEACVATKFCPATEEGEARIAVSWKSCMSMIEEMDPEQYDEELADLVCSEFTGRRSRRSVRTQQPSDISRCSVCKLLVDALDKMAGSNKSVTAVNNTIYGICQAMAGDTLRQQCMADAKAIVRLAEQGLNPQNVCRAAKLCPSQVALVDFVKKYNRPETKVEDTKCGLCKALVNFLDNVLADNATDEQINSTLFNLCVQLPGELQDICDTEASQIMMALKSGFDPETACQKIGLCTSVWGKVLDHAKDIQGELEQNVDDAKCDLCKGLVKFLDNVLADNATDEQINSTLFNLCTQLPGELQDMCDSEATKIVMALKSGFDPETACQKIGLCTSLWERILHDTKSLKIKAAQNVGDLKCDMCKDLIKVLDAVLERNATDEKVNETIYKLCASLPNALQNTCTSMAPMLIKAIESGADPEKVCELVKICTATLSEDVIEKVSKDLKKDVEEKVGDVKCDLCKELVQVLDSVLGNNATDEKINSTLFQLCNQLPGELKDLCMSDAPNIVKALESGFDPEKACGLVKLCTAEQEMWVMHLISLFKNGDGNVNDAKCDLCKELVKVLDAALAANSTDEKINATIFQLCNQLPGQLRDICLSDAPNIVNTLESGVDPEKACEFLTLCTAEQESVAVEEPVEVEEEDVRVGDVKCDLCKELVQVLDAALGNNASEEKINSTLFQLCDQLPGELKDLCLSDAPNIMKALESGFDPEKACELVRLCSAIKELEGVQQPVVIVEEDFQVGDMKCDLCKELVQVLDSVLGNNATEEKINTTLFQLCDQLPGELKDLCISDAPNIVEALESGFDPAQACQLAQLCTAEVEETVEAGPVCALCEFVINVADTFIAENSTEVQIQAVLENVCSFLPDTIRSECTVFVQNYTEVIVNLLVLNVSPEKVCNLIKVCTTTPEIAVAKEEPRLLGNEGAGLQVEGPVPVGDLKCDLCELLVNAVDDLLKENKSIAALNETIFKICLALPSNLSLTCQAIAPQLILELSNGLPPKQACTAIKLCTSYQLDLPTGQSKTCKACMNTMQHVYDYLTDNYYPIRRHLVEICHKLPHPESNSSARWSGQTPLKEKCLKVAENLVPFLVNTILIPGVFCLNVGACPDNIPPPSLVNSSGVY